MRTTTSFAEAQPLADAPKRLAEALPALRRALGAACFDSLARIWALGAPSADRLVPDFLAFIQQQPVARASARPRPVLAAAVQPRDADRA